MPRATYTTKEIPKEGDVDLKDVFTGEGYCKRCKRGYGKLREHFQKAHVPNPKRRRTSTLKVIPASGKVQVKDVYAGEGKCNIKGCKKTVKDLRDHFRNKHLKQMVRCPTCGKMLGKSSIREHKKRHTVPHKCSTCDFESVSLQGCIKHITRRHGGVTGGTPIPLTTDEIKDFHLEKQAMRERTALREVGRTKIKMMGAKLDEYERRLREPSDFLHVRAQRLLNTFHQLLDIPDDALISSHASFTSVWSLDWKIPQVVFQILDKVSEPKIFESTSFFADPQVGVLAQPRETDYFYSGQQRGHLASAADFNNMWLVLPTYYYTNIVPMSPSLNHDVREPLERHLRDTANAHDGAMVIHFPIMDGPPITIGRRQVRVPSAVGTILMVRKTTGFHITGWELYNNDSSYDLNDLRRDPFALMEKVGLRFRYGRETFSYVSHDAR